MEKIVNFDSLQAYPNEVVMRRELRGWRVLLTGASQGIGEALALELAKAGARLALTARSEEKLEEVVQAVRIAGGEAHGIPGDLTHDEERKAILASAVEVLGGLDGVINNAGLGSWNHFADGNEQGFRDMMEINFFTPAELMREAIPVLMKGHQPAILNVASRCGRCALPSWTEYSASKAALVGLTESLRTEYARFGIEVLMALPGKTSTGFLKNCRMATGKAQLKFEEGMPPATVAKALVNQLVRNKRETWIGRDSYWMLMVQRFMPGLVRRKLASKVRELYAPAA
jgi:short-subunit dehydrogenase